MKKLIYISFFFLTLINTCKSYCQSAYEQNKNIPIHITNFNHRYNFSQTYAYDFDLKEATTYSYSVNFILILEITNDGTGRLVSVFNGEKTIVKIISCYKYNDYYAINSINEYGIEVQGVLTFKNNRIDKFWVKNKNNIAAVFE